MDPYRSQVGYPSQENNFTFPNNSVQTDNGAFGQGHGIPVANDFTIGRGQYDNNNPQSTGPRLICPYIDCKRPKKIPFKSAARLAGHIKKYHQSNDTAQLTTNDAEGVDDLGAVKERGDIPRMHRHGAGFTGDSEHDELMELKAQSRRLKTAVEENEAKNKALAERIYQLQRQQNIPPRPLWYGPTSQPAQTPNYTVDHPTYRPLPADPAWSDLSGLPTVSPPSSGALAQYNFTHQQHVYLNQPRAPPQYNFDHGQPTSSSLLSPPAQLNSPHPQPVSSSPPVPPFQHRSHQQPGTYTWPGGRPNRNSATEVHFGPRATYEKRSQDKPSDSY